MQFREVEPVIKSTFFEICVNRAATNVDLCLPWFVYNLLLCIYLSNYLGFLVNSRSVETHKYAIPKL